MISAVVPFRDWSLERLETSIRCLRQIPSITEVILVDFGSSEAIPPVPGCRIVRVEADRWCLSEANNIGIAEAQNAVVLKIDADVQLLLANDVLEDLAGKLAGGEASFYVLQATDFQYENGEPSRKRLRANWAEGCCNLFSRADVMEIGGFDTRYFDYGGEDNDLCQRLRRYGKRVEFFLSDKVLHERHQPSEARLKGRFTDTHKNALLADRSIFRPNPFRYSEYPGASGFGPAITVAIATTARPNRAEHLAHCLDGLAAQSVQDFEVLICENGSPDAEQLDLEALRSAHPTLDIRLHDLDAPSIPKARNLITDHARGFYIAVHDDDDYSLPSRFEEQLDCMARQEGLHGCHSSWIEFDEASGRLTSYLGQVRDITQLLRRRGKVTLHSSGFYRKDVLKRLRYDESLTLGSDYELNVRMLLTGLDILHTGKFHCLRRLHGASVSSHGASTQRDVSDRTNGAYKYFLGEPFLSAVRAEKEEPLWVTGFPTMREMLAYLPADFGAFRIDLGLEAALELGFDPVFGCAQETRQVRIDGLDFAPAYQGFGHGTRFVMRSDRALTAGEARATLPALAGLHGVDVVADVELRSPQTQHGLAGLRVDRGRRRVISRRYATMAEALAALPGSLSTIGLGQIEFFAVNEPAEGVHVLLGIFGTVRDLDHALGLANAEAIGDFFAVTNKGKRGGFLEA